MIMLPREVVERALDALARGCPPDCKDGMTDSGGVHPWGESALIECPSCQAVEALRAALKHQDTGNPATAPEGWKLVPVEPTRDMLTNWIKADVVSNRTAPDLYRAMLDAAPQPPEHYDQRALDLCMMTCGWKTMIPGDCCLNCARQKPQVVEMTTDEWIDQNVSGNPDLIKAMKIIARPESVEHDRPQPPVVEQPPKLHPLPSDLYDSKDWRSGTYAERVEWLHNTMYESAKEQIAELERPRPGAAPYLYYDPANGDTWTNEAINDGCCLPDGLIALYTK